MPLEAVQIGESTYRIEDNGVRCLLFIGRERSLLVDAGFGGENSLKRLVESLTDKPVKLVITHADPDHIGGAAEFDAVYMHKNEIARYTRVARATPRICPLGENDIIDIGGRCFEVLLLPGHTWGSIALLDRENRIVLVGDLASSMPVFMFGEDRDLGAYLASMEKLSRMKTAFDEIYPGHGTLPLPPGQIDKLIAAAKKLLAGELSPEDPPFPMPAKMYIYDGAGFFY
jgi:glyoxylase-like metal-dependent hydrolase (beta-lactamase superfamily II)